MRAILSTARLFLAFLLAVAMPQQSFCLANSEFQHQPLVRFAVSLDPPQDKNFAVIDPTLETLKKEFGEQNIRITKYSLPDLEKALKDGEVDVFISTSGLCRRMAQNGARDLITLVSNRLPDPNHAYGTLFIVRADSDIHTFADMKGKRLAANMPGGFYGYQIALGELLRRGYDHQTFFSETTFVGRDLRAVVNAVLSGKADVGTLSSCFLEDTYVKDSPERQALRFIGLRKENRQTCLRSTDLYPNWTISTMPTTSAEISKRVTQALLNMPLIEGGIGWSIATDFSATDRLFRELQVGPFEYLRGWFLTEFVRSYWQWAVLVLLVGLALFGHSLLMSALVRRRTKALTQALSREIELKKATDIANDKLQSMSRVLIISQLGSLIAHEIRQPLAAIDAYAHGTLRFLEEGKMDAASVSRVMQLIQRQAAKAEEIVDRVRSYAKAKQVPKAAVNLSMCVRQACASFTQNSKYAAVRLETSLPTDKPFQIMASEMEIRLAVDNLIRNAAESLLSGNCSQPLIRVQVTSTSDSIVIRVTDNGAKLTDTDIERMKTPLSSSKSDGLGLGLSIVSGVAQSNSGKLILKAREKGGLIAELSFPK